MFENVQTVAKTETRVQASSIFLSKVFGWMAAGLLITALASFLTLYSGLAVKIFQSSALLILCVVELGLVFYLSARIQKMQAATATALFCGYSFLNGVTISYIFLLYTKTSIISTFLITAGMFGAMAIYGLATKRDLSGLGSFMMMGLIGVIIASVVNIFLKSTAVYWVITYIGVLIFTGLAAYDVQKIKRMGEQGIMTQGGEVVRKGAIMGALTLYLDFINLFLMLLRIFGNRD